MSETIERLEREKKALEDCLQEVAEALNSYQPDPRKVWASLDLYKKDLLANIERLKEKAAAYDNMFIGSNIDAMVYCLIKDMSGMDLWRKVFNKMNKPSKRQLIGELLNSCLGNGYNTKPYMFDYSKKEEENEDKENW